MSTIDVRQASSDPVSRILFSNTSNGSKVLAHRLVQWEDYVAIEDGTSQKVLLESKEHGLNAIKAIQKAIALGWLE